MGSYVRENWKYVSGVLGPRRGFMWPASFHQPDPLPSDTEVSKALKIDIGTCDCSCDSQFSSVVDFISDIQFDKNSEYIERLEDKFERAFDEVCRIKSELKEILSLPEEEQSKALLDFAKHLDNSVDDIAEVELPGSWLIHEGVLNMKPETLTLFNEYSDRLFLFDTSRDHWISELGNIKVVVYKDEYTISSAGNFIRVKPNSVSTGTTSKSINLSSDKMRELFKDWTEPTQEECDMFAMIYSGFTYPVKEIKKGIASGA